jgi:4-alpha-glucanotransferase
MTTRDHERLDRIVERYAEKMPCWMARFVLWVRRPSLRVPRLVAGVLLILGGIVGFLPILGFWMVPLGLLLLAQDVTFLRRPVVNAIYWAERKWQARQRRKASS